MFARINKFVNERPFTYLSICIVVFSIVYYWAVYSVSSDQVRLMGEIKKIANEPIRSIVIEPYDLVPKNFKNEISNIKDIKSVQDFFKNVDTKPVVGGHVYPLFYYKVTFVLKDGTNFKFLVNVYSDKPADAYFSDNFYTQDKDGNWSQWAMKPVFITGLGAWLSSKEPRGENK